MKYKGDLTATGATESSVPDAAPERASEASFEGISIIIPAYNEATRLGQTLNAVRTLENFGRLEVIVVDDGSRDNTAEIAESAGADTVFRQTNSGKGAAVQMGYNLCHGDILLLLDADLGATASEARLLLEPVLNGAADMTIATFPVQPGRGGGMGLVVRVARWGIQRLTGQIMAAPLSGQRALKRAVVMQCGGFAPGWGLEIDLTVRAIWAGFRVQEIATNMDHRVTGRSAAAILHRARQFWAAWKVLLRLWASKRSTRIPSVKERKQVG